MQLQSQVAHLETKTVVQKDPSLHHTNAQSWLSFNEVDTEKESSMWKIKQNKNCSDSGSQPSGQKIVKEALCWFREGIRSMSLSPYTPQWTKGSVFLRPVLSWTTVEQSWLLINIRGTLPQWAAPFPGHLVLGYIRKLAKHESLSELESKQHSFMISAACSCLSSCSISITCGWFSF